MTTLINVRPAVTVKLSVDNDFEFLTLTAEDTKGRIRFFNFLKEEALELASSLKVMKDLMENNPNIDRHGIRTANHSITWVRGAVFIRRDNVGIQTARLNMLCNDTMDNPHVDVIGRLIAIMEMFGTRKFDYKEHSVESDCVKLMNYEEDVLRNPDKGIWKFQSLQVILRKRHSHMLPIISLANGEDHITTTMTKHMTLKGLVAALERSIKGEVFVATETGENAYGRSCFLYHSMEPVSKDGPTVLRITRSTGTSAPTIGLAVTPELVGFLTAAITSANEL